MCNADALMFFQAGNCNDQIPAKVYEYMYTRKPIVAFVDPNSDTGQLLTRVGVTSVAKLEGKDAITAQLKTFLQQLRFGSPFIVPEDIAIQFSRKTLAGKLGAVLKRAADSN